MADGLDVLLSEVNIHLALDAGLLGCWADN